MTETTIKKPQVKAYIKVCTPPAIHLFKGGRKGAVGLCRYAQMINQIWHACGEADPYADLCLVRTFIRVMDLEDDIAALTSSYQKKLNETGNNISTALVTFKQFDLKFSNPYAYMAARRIEAFDKMVQAMDISMQVGLTTPRETMPDLKNTAKEIRQLLSLPLHWHKTGVTREDIVLDNELAKVAKKKM